MLLTTVVSVTSLGATKVGELRWGREIGVPISVSPTYLHFYRDANGHEYVVTNIRGGGVLLINVDDPTNPYIASVALADLDTFRLLADATDELGVADVEIFGRWMFVGIGSRSSGGMEIWDISDGTAPAKVGVVFFDGSSIGINGGVHTIYVDTLRSRLYVSLNFRSMHIVKVDTNRLAVGDVLGALDVRDSISVDNGSYHHDIYVVHGTGVDTVYTFAGFGGDDVCPPGKKGITRWIVVDNILDRVIDSGYVAKCSGYGFSHSGRMWGDSLLINFYESDGSGFAIYRLNKSGGISVAETLVYYRASGFGRVSSVHEGEIKDSLLYVAYYWGGLRIYDLRDPRRPAPVGYYDFYDEVEGEHIFNGASDVKLMGGYIYVVGYSGYPYYTPDRDSGYLYIFQFNNTYTVGEETVVVRGCKYPTHLRINLTVSDTNVEHGVDIGRSDTAVVRLPLGSYRVEVHQEFDTIEAVLDTFTMVVNGTPGLFNSGGECAGLKYNGGDKVKVIGDVTSAVFVSNGRVVYLEGKGNAWSGQYVLGRGEEVAMAGERDVCMDHDIVWIRGDTLKYAAKPIGTSGAMVFDSLPRGGNWKNIRLLNVVRVWDTLNNYLMHVFFVADSTNGKSYVVHNTYRPYNICPITTLPALIGSEVLWEVNGASGLSVDEWSSGTEKLHVVWLSRDTLYYANWDGTVWGDTAILSVGSFSRVIREPTVKVEGGEVYVGWVETNGGWLFSSMTGWGMWRSGGLWRDTFQIYTARSISRVHYAGRGYYVMGYTNGFRSTFTSELLAHDVNNNISFNMTDAPGVEDEWPYSSVSIGYPTYNWIFRNVWEEREGWRRWLRIGEYEYTTPIMGFMRGVTPVYRGNGVYVGDSGGVYVVEVVRGDVALRLGGRYMGRYGVGDMVIVPEWVYEDGKVEIEGVGGEVVLYHFSGRGGGTGSGPMGVGRRPISSAVIGREFVEVKHVGVVRIYDASGREVRRVKVEGKGKVYVGDLPSGVYFLRLGRETIKFIRR